MLDPAIVIPTKSAYDGLDSTSNTGRDMRKLYRGKQQVYATIVLRQWANYGLVVFIKPKATSYPNGASKEFIFCLKTHNTPWDPTTKVELYDDLEKVKTKGTTAYYKQLCGGQGEL